jgi:hypothetical protein
MDISDPRNVKQLAEFKPQPLASVGAEDPRLSSDTLPDRTDNKVVMWSYPVIEDGLIYVVDLRNGLYILEYTGPYEREVHDVKFLEGNSNQGDALCYEPVEGQVGVDCSAHTETQASAGGTVPATLSLTLGAGASFGAFIPGVTKDYTAQTTAKVVSSAGDALLTHSDPGHLMNGTFALASPLQVALSRSSWSAPVSNDEVTVSFTQHVDADDALRTGTYSKTLTFTLSTTNP